ncbi:hypothetical protein M1563_01475 [Patescibacteria group bacterium]|nr:hypothetical protein [Patescibacteria group bacterium]MCL5409376.1 hypothetical protein [Patescibacteria group bacterium]
MKFLPFFLIGILFGLGAILLIYFTNDQSQLLQETVLINQPTNQFSISYPPSLSLTGKVASMSGEIMWEGRTATQAALITGPVDLEQGTMLQTGDNGQVSAEFANAVSISMLANSQVSFTQTLPNDFVVQQTSGQITYTKLAQIPVSVRVLHLLIDQAQGQVTVIVDPDHGLITVDVLTGQVLVAFNDTNLVSHTLQITAPKRLIFNDQNRSTRLLGLR